MATGEALVAIVSAEIVPADAVAGAASLVFAAPATAAGGAPWSVAGSAGLAATLGVEMGVTVGEGAGGTAGIGTMGGSVARAINCSSRMIEIGC